MRIPIPRIPSHCARCGDRLRASTMSKFNTEQICLLCKMDETLAPGYALADEAECAAVNRRDYNFPGAGLRPADIAFIAQRLRERRYRAEDSRGREAAV